MDYDLQPVRDLKPPTRTELEKRLLDINDRMAALTPGQFKMPENLAAKVSQRTKDQQLITPDVEVLRQLLLEKARIASQLQDVPQRADDMHAYKAGFSVNAKASKLR